MQLHQVAQLLQRQSNFNVELLLFVATAQQRNFISRNGIATPWRCGVARGGNGGATTQQFMQASPWHLTEQPQNKSCGVQFNLAQYHSFADVINYLNALAITYPERVSVQPIGTSHEGRQIPLIKKQSSFAEHLRNPTTWIV
ncbi:hypothetical protein ANCDUO_03715 [Ancylostoma duodenale]|uniref:Peptidase M14 domain-containing protein n=1 Tax=Ancylostoma duodenale TaxID=51022 RepID=A0A0C2H8U7_9BILA|nr:hypothetical protein ANCDUO_03715 [Ancylostoma duodenale]